MVEKQVLKKLFLFFLLSSPVNIANMTRKRKKEKEKGSRRLDDRVLPKQPTPLMKKKIKNLFFFFLCQHTNSCNAFSFYYETPKKYPHMFDHVLFFVCHFKDRRIETTDLLRRFSFHPFSKTKIIFSRNDIE